MKRLATVLLVLLVFGLAQAQVTVTGTNPTDGATNVPLNIVLSISFSADIDTMAFTPDDGIISNVDSVLGMYWSTDSRTVYFPAVLQPNSVYFMVIYHIPGVGGQTLTAPHDVHWTTASSFPADVYSVSGSVLSGSTGISTANALVALTDGGVSAGDPVFIAGTVADGAGNFTIPYVPAGTWDPVAAKDANGDGRIDPSMGDPIGTGDPVSVTTQNVSGVTITFTIQQPITFADARDAAVAYAQLSLPPTREMKRVSAWRVDSLGRAFEWEFYYVVPGSTGVDRIRVDMFGTSLENRTGDWDYVIPGKPIPDIMTAAPADTFIAKVERGGGSLFRQSMPPGDTVEFVAQIDLGDQVYGMIPYLVPDTSKLYWAAAYRIGYNFQSYYPTILDEEFYLGDFTTGDLVGLTAVEDQPDEQLPAGFALGQNYPNPFNPSTTIRYQLSQSSLVLLTVFDILGREVAQLVQERQEAGTHSVTFDGSGLPSGVYIYRLQADHRVQTMKMMLMK